MFQALKPLCWSPWPRPERVRRFIRLAVPVLAVLLWCQPSWAEGNPAPAPPPTSFAHLHWHVSRVLASSPQGPLYVLPWLDVNPADLAPQSALTPAEKASVEDIETTLEPGIEDKAPIRTYLWNQAEATGYWRLLARAHKFPAEAFAQKARKDVHRVHLWEEPTKYRAAIIHVEGILRRVRRYDPPRISRKDGVENLYEGWLTEAGDNRNLWCLIFTDLPAGLEVGEKLQQEVAFDGYFFKLYAYPVEGEGGKKKWDAGPLLIGHAPVLKRPQPQDNATWSMTETLLPAFLGFVAAVIVLSLVVGWWFRRSDQRVRQRLAAARQPGFPGPDADVPPARFPETGSGPAPEG
jgi:hypothetical protein